jgi:hypothetical protein
VSRTRAAQRSSGTSLRRRRRASCDARCVGRDAVCLFVFTPTSARCLSVVVRAPRGAHGRARVQQLASALCQPMALSAARVYRRVSTPRVSTPRHHAAVFSCTFRVYRRVVRGGQLFVVVMWCMVVYGVMRVWWHSLSPVPAHHCYHACRPGRRRRRPGLSGAGRAVCVSA